MKSTMMRGIKSRVDHLGRLILLFALCALSTKFTAQTVSNYGLDSLGFSSEFTCSALDPNGKIWMGSMDRGACLFENNSWSCFDSANSGMPHNKIRDIECRLNEVWFTHGMDNYINEGVTIFENSTWTYSEYNGNSLFASRAGDPCFQTNPTFKPWMVTSYALLKWDLNASPGNVFYPPPINSPTSEINHMVFDDFGRLWAATSGHGLVRFNIDMSWEEYNTQNSDIPSDTITKVKIDHQGTIWLASNQGVVSLDTLVEEFEIHNTANSNLPSNQIRDLSVNVKFRVCVATDQGVTILNSGAFLLDSAETGLPTNDIHTVIMVDDNEFWMGHAKGVSRVKYDPALSNASDAFMLKQTWQIYPNPVESSGTIRIRREADSPRIRNLNIRDSNGRLVFTKVIEDASNKFFELQINHLSPGQYFIHSTDTPELAPAMFIVH